MSEKKKFTRKVGKDHNIINSFILKYGLKFILGIVVIIVFLTTVQCSIRKPEVPTWNTDFVVPLINRTYTMSEIISKIDQPGLEINGDGDVVYSFEHEIDTIMVNDNLSINDIHQSVSEVLGPVDIYPKNPAPSVVSLSDYVSLILGGIPDISFDIEIDMPVISGYNWADISSGTAYIKVTNNFGLDLDTVIALIIDLSDTSLVEAVPFPDPGIPAGVTDSVAIDLGGKRVSNAFQLQIHCHTPGAASFSLSPDKELIAALDFSNGFTITSAEAETPAINLDFSQSVALSDSNTIMSAELSSGSLQISIQNGTNLPGNVNVQIPDFNISGQPLGVTCIVGPQSVENVNIDLAGYSFEPADQVSPQEFIIEAAVSIDESSGWVVVDESNSFRVDADITNLNFADMTGIINSAAANFNGIEIELEVPRGFDSIQLVNAVLVLEIENAIGFPGLLNVNISGNGGQFLNLNGDISAGSPDNPSVTLITDSSAASFLNPVPGTITVNGSATFGDGSTAGTVTANDYVFSKVGISAPLEIIINRASFVGDTASEDIDTHDIDIVTEHLILAEFLPTVANHLPLGVEVEIYVDSDSTRLNAYQAQLTIGPLQVAAGEVDANGIVVSPTISELSIILDSLDVQILNNDRLFTSQNITIVGDGINPVKLTGADYVGVQGIIEICYQFDGEF